MSEIGKGMLVYIGFCELDTAESIQKSLKKLCALRIFDDGSDKLNLSLNDIGGEMLLVSNFTLYADCSRGNRPSYINSAKYDNAQRLYDFSIGYIRNYGIRLKCGVFGEDMKIASTADGPVNIIIDSKDV